MAKRERAHRATRRDAVSTRQKLIEARRRCPKVSRSRLRSVRDDLATTRTALTETLHRYWLVPEHDIRGKLAHTEKLIGKAVEVLSKAA